MKPNKSRLYSKIDEFATLKRGWDGIYSLPINEEVRRLTKELVGRLTESECELFEAFPCGDGGIQLETTLETSYFEVVVYEGPSYGVYTMIHTKDGDDENEYDTTDINSVVNHIRVFLPA